MSSEFDERPIKVSQMDISIDQYNENSVPPHSLANETKNNKTGEEAPQPTIDIAEMPIKISNVDISLDKYDENSVPPFVESPVPEGNIVKSLPSKNVKVEEEKNSPESHTEDKPFPVQDLTSFHMNFYAHSIPLFSMYIIQCFVSKSFSQQEYAMKQILEKLKRDPEQDCNLLVSALHPTMQSSFGDTRPRIVEYAVDIYSALIGIFDFLTFRLFT
jgi:hypothetical protein